MSKNKRYINKNGFTLIELLAVIVVLAIVMLIGANAILPLIEDSRVGGFASTARTVVGTAETYYLSQELQDAGKPCYTVKELIDDGYLRGVSPDRYVGIVEIEEPSAASEAKDVKIMITLVDKTNAYYIYKDTSTGNIVEKDIVNYNSKEHGGGTSEKPVEAKDAAIPCPTD